MRLFRSSNKRIRVAKIITLLIALLAVGAVIIFVAQQRQMEDAANRPVKWAYDSEKKEWFVKEGRAPACKDPFVFDRTPFDISQATSAGGGGTYRGFSYKPHGGFRLDNSSDGKIDIFMPIDAKLVSATRYYEGSPPDLQHLLTFETDCGIAFRFDHIANLASKLQEYVNQTPAPKLNDTRSSPDEQPEPIYLKSGELIATSVGFKQSKNFGFDFGVYDYRKRNVISSNLEWVALHSEYTDLEWHGVCWFDMLPGPDAAKATALNRVQVDSRRPLVMVSDYCPGQHLTLEFNGGRPVESY